MLKFHEQPVFPPSRAQRERRSEGIQAALSLVSYSANLEKQGTSHVGSSSLVENVVCFDNLLMWLMRLLLFAT